MDLDSKKHFSLKKWVTNKINRKFIFIFSIIFLITLSNVILVYNLQSSQKSDGALIDAAGRNRMLSQRIGYYSEMVAKGHEEDRAPLLSFIELHHTSFYALKALNLFYYEIFRNLPRLTLQVSLFCAIFISFH